AFDIIGGKPMETMAIVGLLMIVVVGFFICLLFILYTPGVVWFLNAIAYRRIRQLGYFRRTAAILVLGVDVVTLLAVIGVIGTIVTLLPHRNHWELWELFLVTCTTCISIVMFVAFGGAVLVRKLPKRDFTRFRVFGRRRVRFPFIFIGYLTIAGGAVAGLM